MQSNSITPLKYKVFVTLETVVSHLNWVAYGKGMQSNKANNGGTSCLLKNKGTGVACLV